MTPEKFNELLQKARTEGSNDTLLDTIMTEHALLFINEIDEDLTDDQHDQLLNAYIVGFVTSI